MNYEVKKSIYKDKNNNTFKNKLVKAFTICTFSTILTYKFFIK